MCVSLNLSMNQLTIGGVQLLSSLLTHKKVDLFHDQLSRANSIFMKEMMLCLTQNNIEQRLNQFFLDSFRNTCVSSNKSFLEFNSNCVYDIDYLRILLLSIYQH